MRETYSAIALFVFLVIGVAIGFVIGQNVHCVSFLNTTGCVITR